MILAKQLHCIILILVMTLGLGLALSSIKTHSTEITQYGVQVHSVLSAADIENSDIGAITVVNQASQFNHPKQLHLDYIWVLILAIFFIPVVSYRHFKPSPFSIPWFFLARQRSRVFASGWKMNNFLYKLRTQHLHKH